MLWRRHIDLEKVQDTPSTFYKIKQWLSMANNLVLMVNFFNISDKIYSTNICRESLAGPAGHADGRGRSQDGNLIGYGVTLL